MAALNKPRIYYDNFLTRRDASGNFVVPDANITVTDTFAGDYNKANVRDWRKFTRHKFSDAAGSKVIKFDYGSNIAASAMIIFGHNLSGSTVQLHASTDDITYVAITSAFSPTDNTLILKEFSSSARRYWRLTLSALAAIPEIGELFVGTYLELPWYMGPNFNPEPLDVESQDLESVEGHPLGVNVDWVKLQYDIDMFPCSDAFIESASVPGFQDFKQRCYVRREPFFFCWDSGQHPQQTYLMRVPKGTILDVPYERAGRHLKMSMIGKTEDFES